MGCSNLWPFAFSCCRLGPIYQIFDCMSGYQSTRRFFLDCQMQTPAELRTLTWFHLRAGTPELPEELMVLAAASSFD